MALALGQPQGPVDAVGDDDKFRIRSRMEIVGLLRAVSKHREIVTVQFGGGQDFVVSAVLAVNPDYEELVLDYGADESAMQRLFRAPRLRLSTQLDHVRVSFNAEAAEVVSFEGGKAFRVRLPDSLLRFQRRDAYRLKIPLSRPLMCHVPVPGSATPLAVKVRDISVAGVGLTDYPATLVLGMGTVLAGCRINLPDLGPLIADIEVMHATQGEVRRCGCRFRNLPLPMANLIQRYITRVEREQHATR